MGNDAHNDQNEIHTWQKRVIFVVKERQKIEKNVVIKSCFV